MHEPRSPTGPEVGIDDRPFNGTCPGAHPGRLDEADVDRPTSATGRRLRSVDAFRGIVLALMVLTPATGAADRYTWLRHSPWDGATLSDLIFPTFLVTSGISLAFLLKPPTVRSTHVRLVRRVLLLVVIGLIYNAYGGTGFDLGELRFTGVLQTIGVSGAVAALVVLTARHSSPSGDDRPVVLAGAAVLLLGVYGAVLAWSDRCGGEVFCNPWFDLDTALLGRSHTYAGGTRGYDPEGIAVTIAAASLVLVGYIAGWLVLRCRRQVPRFAPWLAAAGVVLVVAGLALDPLQAINKRLLTPAFVLLASGSALLGFAVVAILFDQPVRGRAGAAIEPVRSAALVPFVALGRNALIVFVLERFLLQTATMVHVGDQTARNWILEQIPVGLPASHLVYTALVLAIILGVVVPLHRRRWYLAL